MPRPKKEKATHSTGLYVYKLDIGKDMAGNRQRKSFYSGTSKEDAKKKAEAWRIEQKALHLAGTVSVSDKVTFSEWARRWLEVYKKPHVSANTYAFTYENSVEKHLIPYFGSANIDNIKPIDVQHFFDSKTSLSPSMLNKLHLCLMAIFETALENDLCRKNPVKHVICTSNAEKNEKKVYSKKDMETVIEYARTIKPEVAIILETGLRRGELCGLKWNDIDYEHQTLEVRRSISDNSETGKPEEVSPKWDSYRTIPLTGRTIAILKTLDRTNEYVFPNAKGNVHSPNYWSGSLKNFMKNMNKKYPNIQQLTAHELRHTFGTDLRRRGVDIYTIQKVLGHKDVNITSETYVHNEIEVLRKAMKLTPETNNK